MLGFLSAGQRRILEVACARLMLADDEPDAVEHGAADYIDGLLGAFVADPPWIWAGGPFSGRFGGTQSFASFHKLAAPEELAWRTRIKGSRGIPDRERLGRVEGLQQEYTAARRRSARTFPAWPPISSTSGSGRLGRSPACSTGRCARAFMRRLSTAATATCEAGSRSDTSEIPSPAATVIRK